MSSSSYQGRRVSPQSGPSSKKQSAAPAPAKKQPAAAAPVKKRPAQAAPERQQSAPKKQPAPKKSGGGARILILLLVLAVFIAVGFSTLKKSGGVIKTGASDQSSPDLSLAEETAVPTETAEVEEVVSFNPHCTEETEPSNQIVSTAIMKNGSILGSSETYQSEEEITFGLGSEYAQLDGIVTFRGDSFRSGPVFGTATLTEHKFNQLWSYSTGTLRVNNRFWSGSGWTGQPIIVKWPAETKAIMNMYDWAKEDDDLVEVIYACMDGKIHFLDLWTGEQTRDDINIGLPFKGAGSLDPRGYPIMYVGSGYSSSSTPSRAYIVNLIDGSIMYEFGVYDSFAPRSSVSFFDSSALVDAETDTLIYPGENGVLYLIHLNTDYDEANGTLTIDPETTEFTFSGIRSSSSSFWYGMEDSAVAYDGYLFVADNGGNLICLNLNTLEIVWAQDVLDDTNDSPVLSVEDGHLYLYISTSYHLGWRSSNTATIPVWKIDAETGEIIWHTDYECYSQDGASGGVQATIALGKNNLDDYIYVSVSRTPNGSDGVLDCLSKETGEIVWSHADSYAWSSPICVYDAEGNGVVIYTPSGGTMLMMDGLTGDILDSLEISDMTVEASPAVYENMMIMGTRSCEILGIELD